MDAHVNAIILPGDPSSNDGVVPNPAMIEVFNKDNADCDREIRPAVGSGPLSGSLPGAGPLLVLIFFWAGGVTLLCDGSDGFGLGADGSTLPGDASVGLGLGAVVGSGTPEASISINNTLNALCPCKAGAVGGCTQLVREVEQLVVARNWCVQEREVLSA